MDTNGEAAAKRALGASVCRFWVLQLAIAVGCDSLLLVSLHHKDSVLKRGCTLPSCDRLDMWYVHWKHGETNTGPVKWMQVSFAFGGIWWFGVSRMNPLLLLHHRFVDP